MTKSGKEALHCLREKMFSPLYLVIMLILVIMTGNLFNWADVAFGTHLNVFNPILVILTVVLFGMYIRCVWRQYKGRKT